MPRPRRALAIFLSVGATAGVLVTAITTPAPLLQAVLRQLGETAAEEYAAAVAGDQVAEGIEYQDARGFLLQDLLMVRQMVASQPGSIR